MVPVPMAEARDKHSTGLELLRERIKGGSRRKDVLNLAQGPVGTLTQQPQPKHKPNAAAPPQPLQRPSHGQAPRARWGAQLCPLMPVQCARSMWQSTAPVPVPCAQRALCPWSSHTAEDRRTCQDTRTVRVAQSTAWPTLTDPTGGSCPCGAPWHEPRAALPGWAGPARACRAAGNRSGRSPWLRRASPEPAVLRAQGPRGHRACGEAEPAGTRADPEPTPGLTALPGDSQPAWGLCHQAQGTTCSGACHSQGTPSLSWGTQGLSSGTPDLSGRDPSPSWRNTISGDVLSFPPAVQGPHPATEGTARPGGDDTPVAVPVPGEPTVGCGFWGYTHCGGGSGVPHPEKVPEGVGGPVTAVGSCGGSARAGEQQGGRQESTGGPYRGVGGRGRGLGVTFKDDLSPGSLQRLHSLIVGGIAEIDAVNSEDGVA